MPQQASLNYRNWVGFENKAPQVGRMVRIILLPDTILWSLGSLHIHIQLQVLSFIMPLQMHLLGIRISSFKNLKIQIQ
ncbi:MAG: Uncharacterised protein [Opitutia bacterium UBA7350]|nr:MAG: Uncharacterised protein [Opitutae bacterium UBA7350]